MTHTCLLIQDQLYRDKITKLRQSVEGHPAARGGGCSSVVVMITPTSGCGQRDWLRRSQKYSQHLGLHGILEYVFIVLDQSVAKPNKNT